jgi:hypothetical protein
MPYEPHNDTAYPSQEWPEDRSLTSRYNSILDVLRQRAIGAIAPYTYQNEAWLSLTLLTPEEHRDELIEQIEEHGGSSEFLTIDDDKIIFRLV